MKAHFHRDKHTMFTAGLAVTAKSWQHLKDHLEMFKQCSLTDPAMGYHSTLRRDTAELER